MILELEITALTDLSLSSDNHTLGQPETHDFIPGRTLWGAVASEAYRRGMDESEAFRLFHQGAIRFLDAVPMRGDDRTYPTPLAWHQLKDSTDTQYKNFALDEVRRQAAGQQHKGSKGGWNIALEDGKFSPVKVDRDYSLRTAVDPSGKARQGLLFGLPVVRAGTRFWTSVSGSQDDLAKVNSLLVGRELRLGRSRNAELGVVLVKERSRQVRDLAPGGGTVSSFSVLCVSRCVFRDGHGAPTLKPSPADFGLDDSWTLDFQQSFIRATSAVHFNSKRGRPESERFAIERGSVLTFSSANSVDLTTVVDFVKGGVGEHRGQGYGDVLVAPRWLTLAQLERVDSDPAKPDASVAEPKDELFAWATARARQKKSLTELHSEAVNLAVELRKARVPASQWGVLRRMAREARFSGSGDLKSRLFGANTGFITTGKRRLSKHWKQAEATLLDACEMKSAEQLPMFLELLASACARPARELVKREGDEG